jgi:hypothetical protein
MDATSGTAVPLFPVTALEMDMRIRNTTTGSAVTVTIDVLRDNATNMTNKDMWLEVMYLGDSSTPLASFQGRASGTGGRLDDINASATDLASSSATWTTTGMSNPNKQKITATFTPQQAGWCLIKVCLAANSVVYVDGPVLS